MKIRKKQMEEEDNLQRNAVKTRKSDFRSHNVEYNNLPNNNPNKSKFLTK